MYNKIWLVSKFYRDYYEGDSMELSDREDEVREFCTGYVLDEILLYG